MRWPLGARAGADGQAVTLRRAARAPRRSRARRGDAVPGEIVVVEPTGAETELLIQAGDAQVVLMTHGRPSVNPGERVGLARRPGEGARVRPGRAAQRLAA